MTKRLIPTNYRTIATYEVNGITNETNREIINFCDRNAFGGTVLRRNDGTATVEVDID